MPERDHHFSPSDYYLQVCLITGLFNSIVSSKLTQRTKVFPVLLPVKLKEILHFYDYCSSLEKLKETIIKLSSEFDQLIPIVRLASFLCSSPFFPPVQPPTRATFLLIQDLLALEVVFKGEGKGQELLKLTVGRHHKQKNSSTDLLIHSQAKKSHNKSFIISFKDVTTKWNAFVLSNAFLNPIFLLLLSKSAQRQS